MASTSSAANRRPMDDAFKDLLMKLSLNMRDEDAESLLFMGGLKWPSGQPFRALASLKMLREHGKFSPGSCDYLRSLFHEIKRCDLAELVLQYMRAYNVDGVASTSRNDSTSVTAGVPAAPESEGALQPIPATGEGEREKRIPSALIPLERVSSDPCCSFSGGSHVVATRESSEYEGACGPVVAKQAEQELSRPPVERTGYVNPTAYKSMQDVHFQSTFCLPTSSQQQGSQVMVESFGDGLHQIYHSSSSSLPSQAPPTNIAINIQMGNSSNSGPSSSLSPHYGPLGKGMAPNPPIPQQLAKPSTSDVQTEVVGPVQKHTQRTNEELFQRGNEKRRSAMFAPLYIADAISEKSEESREADVGSLISSSSGSTPSHSPRPRPRSHLQAKHREWTSDPQGSPKEQRRREAKQPPGKGGRANKTARFTWKVKKPLLCQYIWNHKRQKDYIKYTKRVPVDIGCRDSNPTLSLLLYPFGLFDDRSSSMTLQLKLDIPDKCPPLPPASIFCLTLEIHSQETKITEGKLIACSRRTIAFDRGLVYVKKFLLHDQIKLCECQVIEIRIQTIYQHPDPTTAGEGKGQGLETGHAPKHAENTATVAKQDRRREVDRHCQRGPPETRTAPPRGPQGHHTQEDCGKLTQQQRERRERHQSAADPETDGTGSREETSAVADTGRHPHGS